MTKVVLDLATLAKLSGFVDGLEVCDPAGQTVGFFLPFHAGEPKLCDVTPWISAEERDSRLIQGGASSLDDILGRLEHNLDI